MPTAIAGPARIGPETFTGSAGGALPFGGRLRAHLSQKGLDLLLPAAMAPVAGGQYAFFLCLGNFGKMG